jgi:hypothetical protein
MRGRRFKLGIGLGIAVAAVALGLATAAQATTSVVAPTWPIPAEIPYGPPPIAELPAAADTPPPADQIADPLIGGSCSGWELQNKYGGRWPAGSSWWEYRCTQWDSEFHDPECEGTGGGGGFACNAWCYYCYTETNVWTDYFYWDGSNAVFYGQAYSYSIYYEQWGGYESTSWWDGPTAQWYRG